MLLGTVPHGSSLSWNIVPPVGPSTNPLRSDHSNWWSVRLLFTFNHTAFKLNSLWHVGYLLDDFYGLHICSRASLLLYNPARHPDSIEPPRLLGQMPSYFSVAIVLHHLLTLHHSLLPLNRLRPSGPAAQRPMSRLCYVPSPASCLPRSSP